MKTPLPDTFIKNTMTRVFTIFLFILWGVASVRVALGAGTPSFQTVFPPDGSWVTDKKIFLHGVTGDLKTKHVEISGVKAKTPRGGAVIENDTFGAEVTLKKGLNTILLSSDGVKHHISIYYLSQKAVDKGGEVPDGFRRYYTHMDPKELQCGECHQVRRKALNFKRINPVKYDCTTGGCHDQMGKESFVHGPLGAGVCISCHSPHGSFEPYGMKLTGGDLCFSCHQSAEDDFNKDVIHPPVDEGCIECHDPHESSKRFQLRYEGNLISDLCFQCHEQEEYEKSYIHDPVQEGQCLDCHRPHASAHDKLLVASTENGDLCLQCHEEKEEDLTREYIHPPVEEGCEQCHDPHSADEPVLLLEKGAQLCASCHEEMHPDVFEDIASAKFPHEPAAEGRCVECHLVHSSNFESLLRDTQDRLCLGCHKELSENIQESKNLHGPVQRGECSACHKPHGSLYTRLLEKDFPEEFYVEYQAATYDLCFECHERKIAEEKFTTTLTNFRDGEYNLHFSHVNREKGRSCISCHDAHASNQPKHVRYEVPFGVWFYPVELTLTETGGNCVVGCHAPKKYDRKQPVLK